MSDKTKNVYVDRDAAIKKGQAYNLAIMTACATGHADDNEYIIKSFLKHMQMASLLQKATNDQLVAALNNPEVLELFSKIDGVVTNV